jgi:hypothetical protein
VAESANRCRFSIDEVEQGMIKKICLSAVCVFALCAGSAYGDEILGFTANGLFANGDTLSGHVTIDVTTGNVLTANLLASGPSPQVFNTNVGQIADRPVPGDTEIVADTPNSPYYPVLLLAAPVPNLIGYLGGSLASTASPTFGAYSNYFFSNGSFVDLTSGALTLDTPNDITTFIASGLFANGDALGGDVVIDTTTGSVIQANLYASGPSPQVFNTNVGLINGYPTANDTEIAADSPNSPYYPILLLSAPAPSFIGYQGGSLGSTSALANGVFSEYRFADDSFVPLTSGRLSGVPEPSTFAYSGMVLLLRVIARRANGPGRRGHSNRGRPCYLR